MIQTKGKTVQFEGEDMKLEGKILEKEFKPTWKQVKKCFKNVSEEKRLEQYSKKEMQSEIYKKQDKKCDICLEQNLTPRKTSAIMSMIKQMNETRARKKVRVLTENSADCVKNNRCKQAKLDSACMVMAVGQKNRIY